ncbi:uncharacterized protein [Triticum aestivum]|uniref:uncharacterized protein n=1 Tax=Triticum aestivum TaxID=4565 RepID=UPI001D02636B|nr:uncharacterized protein LOC123058356 [Triticum aestivum]
MIDDGACFEREYVLFEHMGMLCRHVLKVMDNIGMKENTKRHIVKRRTKYPRDILPDHLKHYWLDQINNTSLTFRHNRMYIRALELVRLGDASVEAYQTLMGLLDQAMPVMDPFDKCRDRLGLGRLWITTMWQIPTGSELGEVYVKTTKCHAA